MPGSPANYSEEGLRVTPIGGDFVFAQVEGDANKLAGVQAKEAEGLPLGLLNGSFFENADKGRALSIPHRILVPN